MKIHAWQVNPEYQESPLFVDGFFPPDIILTGNRRLEEHTTPEFDLIRANFEDMAGYFSYSADVDGEEMPLSEIPQLLTDYGFDRKDGKPWTELDCKVWKSLLALAELDDEDIACALELMTRKPWSVVEIHGCCQGDWQTMFFPEEAFDDKALEAFNCEYWNIGTEWQIHDETEDPDIQDYFCYVTEWNEDATREALASIAGCNPDDVVLHWFE